MKHTINYLRTYRKNTHLTQYDIAALLKLKDNSIISRSEKSNRVPSLEMILVYHLLFDIPVLTLFANHVEVVRERLLAGIPPLISQIEQHPGSSHGESRIRFLNDALTRLVSQEAHEE